jgi:hypothetical protein
VPALATASARCPAVAATAANAARAAATSGATTIHSRGASRRTTAVIFFRASDTG